MRYIWDMFMFMCVSVYMYKYLVNTSFQPTKHIHAIIYVYIYNFGISKVTTRGEIRVNNKQGQRYMMAGDISFLHPVCLKLVANVCLISKLSSKEKIRTNLLDMDG